MGRKGKGEGEVLALCYEGHEATLLPPFRPPATAAPPQLRAGTEGGEVTMPRSRSAEHATDGHTPTHPLSHSDKETKRDMYS
ncbi:hypothetical protein E2C01_067532 [Portunus trituberculatus]|uniref:Uncharacterized protein n=1 Tax=Portunus trituberculatus TaxID=210409 RepID=A0A5B7HL97_PORTR|nr:hypothetical protein [Portunus trituberculatus]